MNASIRIASIIDADLLLNWRNDPIVRQFSKSDELISESQHIDWLKARFEKMPSEPLFIFVIDDIEAGTARLDKFLGNAEALEVSILLDPKFQGNGNSRILLNLVCDFAREELGAKKIVAHVHEMNIKSKGLFESEGFKYLRKQGLFLEYHG